MDRDGRILKIRNLETEIQCFKNERAELFKQYDSELHDKEALIVELCDTVGNKPCLLCKHNNSGVTGNLYCTSCRFGINTPSNFAKSL